MVLISVRLSLNTYNLIAVRFASMGLLPALASQAQVWLVARTASQAPTCSGRSGIRPHGTGSAPKACRAPCRVAEEKRGLRSASERH